MREAIFRGELTSLENQSTSVFCFPKYLCFVKSPLPMKLEQKWLETLLGLIMNWYIIGALSLHMTITFINQSTDESYKVEPLQVTNGVKTPINGING